MGWETYESTIQKFNHCIHNHFLFIKLIKLKLLRTVGKPILLRIDRFSVLNFKKKNERAGAAKYDSAPTIWSAAPAPRE